MPAHPNTSRQPYRTARACVIAVAIGFGGALVPASAQSGSGPQETAAEQDRVIPPSRLVTDADIEAHLEKIAAIFAMADRVADPFGAIQDPEAVRPPPVIAEIDQPPPAPVPTIPFTEVVNRISVNTVIPAEGRFLMGARSFRVNDVFPVNFRNETFQIRVDNVSSARITFRNLETDETAHLELSRMPAGMSRGGSENNVPGMTRAGNEAPLQLD